MFVFQFTTILGRPTRSGACYNRVLYYVRLFLPFSGSSLSVCYIIRRRQLSTRMSKTLQYFPTPASIRPEALSHVLGGINDPANGYLSGLSGVFDGPTRKSGESRRPIVH